jgi:hypothetical protein
LKRAAAALLALASLGAHANGEPYWYLQLDNDFFFHTDRWYTSGVRIARVQPDGDRKWEWGLVQEIYTPEAKHYEPLDIDRGPTARLYLSAARHESGPACFQTLELAAGVRGPAAQGERAQNAVHQVISGPEVAWSHQDPDNHFDAQFSAARSDRVGDFTFNYGAVLGTTRILAHAGAQMNVGVPMLAPLLRFAPTPPVVGGAPGWGGYLGLSARGIARDELLNRGYDETLEPPTRNKLVGRLAAGAGVSDRWGTVSLTLALDSREFRQQRIAQPFGSIVVHLDF